MKVVLPLVFFFCLAFGACAVAEDSLGIEGLRIVSTEHTEKYLVKNDALGATNATSNATSNATGDDGGIAQDVNASMQDDIFVIGGKTGMSPDVPAGEEIALTSVSGHWILRLTDGETRRADLVLHQINDVVFGCGNIAAGTEDEESAKTAATHDEGIKSMIDWMDEPPAALGVSSPLTASGTVVGDMLDLDLVSVEEFTLYRLHVTVNDGSILGSYEGYGSDGTTWSGSVAGVLSE
ncbi:MAG: hypothetical protein U9N48_00305 [Euryarchaeota archaeon]|nr:hypothetical protein [Euryarchaeota archaeon]